MHSHRYKPVRREHRATLAGTRICSEKRQNMSVVLDWPQKPNPGTQHLSIQTWASTNLKGQKVAAQEIIRANVSFCFTAHLLFTCNLQIQKSHMAVMRVYKGGMCSGTVLFQEQIAPRIIARAKAQSVCKECFYEYVQQTRSDECEKTIKKIMI